jgi:hypothetical protein
MGKKLFRWKTYVMVQYIGHVDLVLWMKANTEIIRNGLINAWIRNGDMAN